MILLPCRDRYEYYACLLPLGFVSIELPVAILIDEYQAVNLLDDLNREF